MNIVKLAPHLIKKLRSNNNSARSIITMMSTSTSSGETGKTIVISGPSGSGKSTLLKKLFQNHPNQFGLCVSHTTRNPRPGEEDGKDYYFVTRSRFEELRDKDQFLEWAEFSKNLYGTSVPSVKHVLDSGRMCILDIDLQGVHSVKRVGMHLVPRFIFIRPPSTEELNRRLVARKTETAESLEMRLKAAEIELRYAEEHPGFHDIIIVNDDIDRAYHELESFIFDNHQKS